MSIQARELRAHFSHTPATHRSHRVVSEFRRAAIAELVQLQQGIDHQDILTITGFMSDDEVAEHLSRYLALAAKKAGR